MKVAFVSLALATLAAAALGAAPFLVADIDTTGEPVFLPCPFECPPGPGFYGGLPHQLTAFGDRVVFVANDRVHGFEPWVSDGTAAGTFMLGDLCPGPCSANVTVMGAAAKGTVVSAFDGDSCDLWSTDGTETRRVAEGSGLGWCEEWPLGHFDRAVQDGWLHFQIYIPSLSRYVFVRSDGSAAAPEIAIDPCADVAECFGWVSDLLAARDGVYVGTQSYGSPSQLWRIPRHGGSPALVASTCAGDTDSIAPQELTSYGDGLLFTSSCLAGTEPVPTGAIHLYTTDGTPDGTRLVRAFAANPAGGPAWPHHLAARGDGTVVFSVHRQEPGEPWPTRQVWRSDGTAAGTGPVSAERFADQPFVPFTPVGGALAFAASPVPDPEAHEPDPGTAALLWLLGPDGQILTSERLPASVYAIDPVPPLAFHAASLPDYGDEPWGSNGTLAGTGMLADLDPGTPSSSPREFTRAGDLVFFSADVGDLGRELWAVRFEDETVPDPEPPSEDWITSPIYPGFRFQVRITPPNETAIEGVQEPSCQPETVCVSGALPGRSEVFLRILGPRPNGYLWPTIVRFTPSRVEVWIEQEWHTPELEWVRRYYDLPAVPPGVDDLSGRQDRTGFSPVP